MRVWYDGMCDIGMQEVRKRALYQTSILVTNIRKKYENDPKMRVSHKNAGIFVASRHFGDIVGIVGKRAFSNQRAF